MSESNYSLVSIRPQDWEPIRQWRNAQMDVLRQNHIITEEEQQEYAARYYEEVKKDHPSTVLFSYLSMNDKCIGYGGFVHIDYRNERTETSFLLHPALIKDKAIYAFNFIKFHSLLFEKAYMFYKLTAETFEYNTINLRLLELMGYKQEGILKEWILKNGKYIDVVVHGKIL